MITKKIENSSQISEIGYDEEKKVFQVVYKPNGTTYHYFDVDPKLWEEAQAAESVGKFVNAKIKFHKYQLIQY